MLLKGAMRRKQASKTWCLAETCHGESLEACIALRGTYTLTYLACDVSQRRLKPCRRGRKDLRKEGYAPCVGMRVNLSYPA